MNAALLFNSDDPKFKIDYGHPIRAAVFNTGLIQASGRHMKMSVGDVTIYSRARTWEDYDALTERVYFAGTWSLLLEDRLRLTFRRATVYALTFENMTQELAVKLHYALLQDSSYLGVMEVVYSYSPHLALFRNSMIHKCRLQGTSCRLFITMGEEDEKDDYELAEMRRLGFSDVDWEDRGAQGTIFDDYDTLDHFKQIAEFHDEMAAHLKGGSDAASELVMVLEDLNPQLFNALGSAVSALRRARHEEDLCSSGAIWPEIFGETSGRSVRSDR